MLAEEIGLTRSPGRIADALMHGPVRTFTGARANGAPFYLMAGIGFDAETVRRLDLASKRRWGKPAYTRPVLSALTESEPRLLVAAMVAVKPKPLGFSSPTPAATAARSSCRTAPAFISRTCSFISFRRADSSGASRT